MPIKDSGGDVIGVAQVINKMNGECFSEIDEKVSWLPNAAGPLFQHGKLAKVVKCGSQVAAVTVPDVCKLHLLFNKEQKLLYKSFAKCQHMGLSRAATRCARASIPIIKLLKGVYTFWATSCNRHISI